MALARPANAATIDNAMLAPTFDATAVAPKALVYLAMGLMRFAAIAALASPLILVTWLVM